MFQEVRFGIQSASITCAHSSLFALNCTMCSSHGEPRGKVDNETYHLPQDFSNRNLVKGCVFCFKIFNTGESCQFTWNFYEIFPLLNLQHQRFQALILKDEICTQSKLQYICHVLPKLRPGTSCKAGTQHVRVLVGIHAGNSKCCGICSYIVNNSFFNHGFIILYFLYVNFQQ